MIEILQAHCIEALQTLQAESVDCCVTSPPYWGLRDYGLAPQFWPSMEFQPMPGVPAVELPAMQCCHGLESDVVAWVGHQVQVFREVRRVLRKDGVCWVNLGDAYVNAGGAGEQGETGERSGRRHTQEPLIRHGRQAGWKPKDMMGLPWRVAFALQADGWYLRQDIIWSKPNCQPESIRDRCTKSHEYIFLLSKSGRYRFDARAIRERRASAGGPRVSGWASGPGPHTAIAHAVDKGNARTFRGGGKYTSGRERSPEPVMRESTGNVPAKSEFRNRRSVWTIASRPFRDAHFATFPESLIRPCILAGCRPGGVVLDPFAGSGTTGLVAADLGRRAILIEANPDYVAMAQKRLRVTPGLPLES